MNFGLHSVTRYKSFEDDNTLFVCMPEGLKCAARKNDEPPLIKENYGIVEAWWKSIKGGRETIGYVLFDPSNNN